MSTLRILGSLAALGFFAFVARRYARRQVSRLTLIIASFVTLGVLAIAAAPHAFDPLFETFNFQPGNNGRLIALLLAATALLFLLWFRAQATAEEVRWSIRRLVEALGVERFDWEEARRRRGEGPLLVTISPAYNEAENVGAVIHAMPEEVDGFRVLPIVVDDCSEDDTARVAREAGALVARLPIRRGGGLAIRVGYEIALALGADIVVTLDADGQHLPEELPILLKPILEGQADHVNGSRMLGDFEGGPLIRHVGVHFFSWVVTVLTGQRVTDISSGYRATRAETLRRLILEQDQFWASEVTIEALRQRARVTEVPVTFLTRRGGESKKPKSLRYAWNFSKAIAKTWLR
ncbi:MAG: hypothetical protein KatS3mg013_0585 [Actinomycetota bacterium]|jgi:hypothetical protein|nr:MAG: hypothetical protein KatS3mg013_0585 [Actinomycetota bacterium]